MDEPFAVLDPVIRERLQDELIALQRRLKKTIVLVTHDMEEAIKLGDRIAIFEEEGTLVQIDSPRNILANPSSEFVKKFIGKDPSLKRLALMKVSELQRRSVALVNADGVTAEFDKESEIDSSFELLLNERLEPLKWVGKPDFSAPKLTLVSGDESLHHALVKILSTPNGIVVRVDQKGKYEGCISISSLYRALNGSRLESMQ
jgi:osmoprotectant transport system ATP-binding protein